MLEAINQEVSGEAHNRKLTNHQNIACKVLAMWYDVSG
jgi:hypothetical protein